MSNFGLSHVNYMDLSEDLGVYTKTPGIRATLTNGLSHWYGFIPNSGTGNNTVTLSIDGNWSNGYSLSIGCIVLCNVIIPDSGMIIASVTVGGTVYSNVSYYDTALDNCSTMLKLPSNPKVIKCLPLYIDTSDSKASVSSVSVTCNTRWGYTWIGDFYNFDVGFSRPSNMSVESAANSIEMQNGDTFRQSFNAKRKFDMSMQYVTGMDEVFVGSNLHYNSTYFISGYNPFGSNKITAPVNASTTHNYYKWQDYSAIAMLDSNIGMTRKFPGISEFSMNFVEKY